MYGAAKIFSIFLRSPAVFFVPARVRTEILKHKCRLGRPGRRQSGDLGRRLRRRLFRNGETQIRNVEVRRRLEPKGPSGEKPKGPSSTDYFFFVFFAAFGFAAAFDVVVFFAFFFAVIGIWSHSFLHPKNALCALERQHIEQFGQIAQHLVPRRLMRARHAVVNH